MKVLTPGKRLKKGRELQRRGGRISQASPTSLSACIRVRWEEMTILIPHIRSLVLTLVIHANPPASCPRCNRRDLLMICTKPAMIARMSGTGSSTACSKHCVKSRSRV